jgi:CAAX prenyl protease-like protein
VRVLPFALFMLLLAIRGYVPADGSWGFDARWIYGLKALLVAGMLWIWRGEYGELSRQNLPTAREALTAVTVGLAVFALWIQLDAPWMTISAASAPFAPVDAAGRLDWGLVTVRILGAALVVPPMEELFWRSFVMRWIQSERFESVLPAQVGLRAIVLSTFLFMLAHTLWLAAVMAGLAYALLYVRSGKLWLPVIAHAVTNGALGVWVVATGNWQFW